MNVEVLLWGAFLIATLGTAFGLTVFLVKENRAAAIEESAPELSPILGVASTVEDVPRWLVPLSPIEDEEEAWKADRERRDMEK